MKKRIFGIILMFILPLFALTAAVGAQTFRSGDSQTIARGETIDGSAFMAGSSVDVAGTVNGDLYCAGQTVTISGEVTGDVLCAAQVIRISGTVGGDVRLAGQTLTVSGKVGKSASLAGQTMALESAGAIGQDVLFLGQDAVVNGPVGRDIVIASSSATLSSEVKRNVTAYVQSLTLANNAVIGGDVNYTSSQKLTMDNGARVNGEVKFTESSQQTVQRNNVFDPIGILVRTLMLIASALLFALLFPRLLHRTTDKGIASPAQALLALLVGFVAMIVMPFAIIFLMLTVLGIPFAMVILIAWVLILAMSGAFAAYYLGRLVWRKLDNALLIMLVGSAIIAIALTIPIVNIFVWLLAVWYGSGAVLIEQRRVWSTPGYDTKTYTTVVSSSTHKATT